MGKIGQVLITGGAGFVGASLVRFLGDEAGARIRVIDDLRKGDPAYLEGTGAELIRGDAGDPETMREALEGVDAVVHLASETGVVPSVEDPSRDFEGNAQTTFRVLDACRRAEVNRVVFASSGAAVGEVTPPIHEEVVARPSSPYGAGKLAGEAYCQSFASAFGMNTVALRFSNVYGPYSIHKNNAIPNFIKRSLVGAALEIYGDGKQTRDFIYVEDLCRGIHLSLTTDGVAGEVFQLATGVETSVLDLVEQVQAAAGASTEVDFEDKRAGEVYRSSVDISKVKKTLGFEPRVDLRQGLNRTVEWYRENWLPTAEKAPASTPD
jgi:UDP-glucose 4-epimerase